ncbi:MAG TPA: serine/threonine-protein kinase [Polyangiaceae bacterium]|nr:serine/threonine-protein kinase [Polyangiaceae bacterium]
MPQLSPEPALQVTETVPPVSPGQVIGERYLVGSVIGEGGMGVVCIATHVHLGTPVAIKLIRSDLKHDPDSLARFWNEARTAAALKGEHIARVYDFGQLDSGEPYLVMEHLEGLGLDAFLAERGPLSQSEAVDILLQACEGLAEAHSVSLVHRDIKAANLFLVRRPDGQFTLKILDFGIAKRLVDGAHWERTESRGSVGSPFYMPPEQMLEPATVDQRADVWSLGVLLFELLTGEYPFTGDGAVQICANVLTAPTPALSALRPDVAPGVEAIVQRCLEKRADDRYASVLDLAEALRPFGSTAQAASALAPSEGLNLDAPTDRDSPAAIRAAVESEMAAEADGVRGNATVESWSPVIVRSSRRARASRTRWRPSLGTFVATVIAALLLGGALSWLNWPVIANRYAAERRLLQHLKSPWDPVLAPNQADDGLERELPVPELWNLPNTTTNEASAQPATTRESASVQRPVSGALTPEQSRLRAERYERWLREGGMVRLDGEWTEGKSTPTPLDTKDGGEP